MSSLLSTTIRRSVHTKMLKPVVSRNKPDWAALKRGDQATLANAILEHLRAEGSAIYLEGMKRFGIVTTNAYGISLPGLRAIVKEVAPVSKICSNLLWESGYREARLLACWLWDVAQMSRDELHRLPIDMNSWDVCDHACTHLLRNSEHRWSLVYDWVHQEAEFTRRSGFALVATMAAIPDTGQAKDIARSGTDEQFIEWLKGPATQYATDDRNFVKKAVHWSIRAIGKRNASLWDHAVACARTLSQHENATACWVGKESLRELLARGKPKKIRNVKRVKRSRSISKQVSDVAEVLMNLFVVQPV
ncbi:armadillo-type protein [Syncephalis plumigaleata]|nr:armadillo-type protein [Syncephalis plumigaleata]